MASQGSSKGISTDERKQKYTYSASSFKIKTNEEELFELVQLSEVPIDKELFKVILEMLKLNIAPVAILQVLKSLKSPQTPLSSSESIKPTKELSKPDISQHLSKSHSSKSAKRTSSSKVSSSSSQEHKRPSSKNFGRPQKSASTSSTIGSSARKERTTSKT